MRRKLKRRKSTRPPPLTESQILAWADEFHERMGTWPKQTSGRIVGSLGENWCAVDACLCKGFRGLPGGSSLPRLLAQKRGVRNIHDLPPHSESQILAWADAFHERTGKWPKATSGRIAGSLGEKWLGVDVCLRNGFRGLPGGSSLPRLLAHKRGVRNHRGLPPLSEEKILAWADAFHERTGTWPNQTSGRIQGPLDEKWSAVDTCLCNGKRGLPGGSSLARLLSRKRGARNVKDLPPLSEERILEWADAFHERTGAWPNATSGRIQGPLDEKWSAVNGCLLTGGRGLPGGSSLPRLLAQKRGVRNIQDLPPLTTALILRWCDAHQRRTGRWPTTKLGPIQDAPGETWETVNAALFQGRRSLAGGSSLARLLQKQRGVRNSMDLPPLQPRRILAWADAQRRRTGQWPTMRSGQIQDAPGETWEAVDAALRIGSRGLRPGGSSLARLLHKQRGVRNTGDLPPLRPRQILAWADAHRRRTGQWPQAESGPIQEAPGETWKAVHQALHRGRRSLSVGSSLARFLQKHRGVRNMKDLPPLQPRQILAWADAHRQRIGNWPTSKSGPVQDAPGETWEAVNAALRIGCRGLRPGGTSLANLLQSERGVRNIRNLPPLQEQQVLDWADAHRQRTGNWPNRHSGPIHDAPGETWSAVNDALRQGSRGLRRGGSLSRLLKKHRGI